MKTNKGKKQQTNKQRKKKRSNKKIAQTKKPLPHLTSSFIRTRSIFSENAASVEQLPTASTLLIVFVTPLQFTTGLSSTPTDAFLSIRAVCVESEGAW